ncbi:MAG: GTP-binding protein, partial [Phycisphaerales bacterium]|nr:GTP-binding protein [Phycisphaerales bacterium]
MTAKSFSPDKIRNVALLGHGGCGKTAIADAMLFNAKVTTRLGRTDQGTSTFDFEPEEVEKGASIATAVAWLEYDGVKINVLDTPGDMNFMYDAYAALNGADTAIIVVSAPDGVEVQTERFWRRAEEMQMPRVLFISKMDRERADPDAVLSDIEEHLGVKPLPIQVP